MNIKLAIIFLMLGTFTFAQKKNEVKVTGTVYIRSSTSLGIMNGGSTSEGPHPFKHQTIYFQSDSLPMVNATTDSLGKFSIKLKPGIYTVHQSEGLKKQETKGLQYFGTAVIEVKKENEPFKIEFENRSNRRSAMNTNGSPGGLPGSKKPTKNTPVQTQPEQKK